MTEKTKAEETALAEGRSIEIDAGRDRGGWNTNTPRGLVSPLDLAGGLRAPFLSDDELDELCNIEIAALSQPRTNATG